MCRMCRDEMERDFRKAYLKDLKIGIKSDGGKMSVDPLYKDMCNDEDFQKVWVPK